MLWALVDPEAPDQLRGIQKERGSQMKMKRKDVVKELEIRLNQPQPSGRSDYWRGFAAGIEVAIELLTREVEEPEPKPDNTRTGTILDAQPAPGGFRLTVKLDDGTIITQNYPQPGPLTPSAAIEVGEPRRPEPRMVWFSRELLQQALDCLEGITYTGTDGVRRPGYNEFTSLDEEAPVSSTIQALKDALSPCS